MYKLKNADKASFHTPTEARVMPAPRSNSSSTSTSQDLSTTSPAQEGSDGLAPGNWCGLLPEAQNQNKKKGGSRDSDDRL